MQTATATGSVIKYVNRTANKTCCIMNIVGASDARWQQRSKCNAGALSLLPEGPLKPAEMQLLL